VVVVVALLVLPLLIWSWRRGNTEDGELALGVFAWLSMGAAGLVAAFVVWV